MNPLPFMAAIYVPAMQSVVVPFPTVPLSVGRTFSYVSRFAISKADTGRVTSCSVMLYNLHTFYS